MIELQVRFDSCRSLPKLRLWRLLPYGSLLSWKWHLKSSQWLTRQDQQPELHHYWLRQQLLLLCQQLGNYSRKRNRIASCPKVVRMALGISWKGSYPAWLWHLFLAWNMYTNLSLRCSMWEILAKWQRFSKSFLDLGLNSQASRHTCENST